MLEHPGIEIQLQSLCNGVSLTTFVARLLHHAKDPIVSFDMIVGALAVVPPQKHDHVVKLVFAYLLQRPGQKRVGLIRRMVDETRAAHACTLLADAFFKQAVKLLVEGSKHDKVGCNLQHEGEVFLVLLAQLLWFADNEILMLPDEGGLLFLAHALATLSLLLGFLAGTTTPLLAAFVALAFEAVFDRPYPVQDELIDLLDDVKDTQLMFDLGPVTL